MRSYESQEGADPEVCAMFAWRRRELAEELGDADAARHACDHQLAVARAMRKRARKDKHDPPLPQSVIVYFIHAQYIIIKNIYYYVR